VLVVYGTELIVLSDELLEALYEEYEDEEAELVDVGVLMTTELEVDEV